MCCVKTFFSILSLEDKLRLECVSKQFQRTVFRRQYELHINVREEKIYLSDTIRSKCIEVQFNSFEALLKKWPNITSIELEKEPNTNCYLKIPFHSLQVNEVFRHIIENCNNLSEIKVLNDIVLNESNFEEFHQKFVQKIKSLTTLREIFDLNHFPNIEKIVISNVQGHSIIPYLKSPNLKQLDLVVCQGQEHKLQTFINNSPKLTHLKILIKEQKHLAIDIRLSANPIQTYAK